MLISKKLNKIYDIFYSFGATCLAKSILSYFNLFRIRSLNIDSDVDVKKIAIFVISYNRLDCLKELLNFFRARNLIQNVVIIDNNSSYPPLLDFLSHLECRVEYLNENLGHLALWKCHLFDEIINNFPFILTDCDVVPNKDIPKDFLNIMFQKLQEHSDITKVGLSLVLDDIPDTNKKKHEILKWESKFWQKRMIDDKSLFDAQLDTTFAIYRPGIYPYLKQWYSGARMDKPFFARHLGWYIDSDKPTEEELFYVSHIKRGSSHWFSKK